ncbi:hypothetical protein ED733_000057 [Metarhizium rileyi]|uniref:G-patch domain-containing protein n=1 Tax=Metarhizium rileyi (strain RCEF 4871) TaxID=1649241 RepID=A0A5C6G3J5_METRR|nr:hypothetical protein ED733_000057 [Metarhizium rileyi]
MAEPPPPPPPSKAPFSLYDNLLDPKDPIPTATISSAPVLYNQAESCVEAKKSLDPALRFQPIRRPAVKQATKPKGASFLKPIPASKPLGTAEPRSESAYSTPTVSAAPQPAKSTLADWAATEEDEWRYGVVEKRQRGGRKKKKKQQQMQAETDWDEIYDPARPTNIDEYIRSDEKIDEVREWKALLYRHRKKPDESDMSDDEEYDSRPVASNQFAPPSSYAFVPPPPESPAAQNKNADDAYVAMSSSTQPLPPPSPPAEIEAPHPPPAPSDLATITRAPVHYTQAGDSNEEDDAYSPPPTLGEMDRDKNGEPEAQQRSSRPGQAGFAHRLMSKYGWTQGTGLGANETGIINPLRVQVEKRRKKADADGGGWAEPAGKGKIIGSKSREAAGKFGAMSDVIVLQNMLENMPDLQAEIADGLGQEIGEECGEKYGRVERLYIDQTTRQVFIKFTNQVSALRAVNELDGRVFNGNTIIPRFFDSETFEKGIYNLQ